MNIMPEGRLQKGITVTKEDVEFVRNYYKVTDETIKRDVTILKDWIKQQRHLPQTADDGFLERCLLNNKFRIEKTKKKLDDYYTMRGLYRHMYYQPNNSKFLPSKINITMVPFPILTPDRIRLIYVNVDGNAELFDQLDFEKYQNLHYELLLKYDYSLGMRFIYDCNGLTLDHAKKVSVADLSNNYLLFKNSYSARMVGLELVNTPKYMHVFMALVKLAFPEKFYNKFHIHKDFQTFLKSLPKQCLPKDFGGDLENMDEIIKNYWDPIFLDHMDFFRENMENVSNESLRIGATPNSGLFGVEGTFKTLTLD